MTPDSGVIYFQDVLGSGSTVLYTGSAGFLATIAGITFNNPSAITVTMSFFKNSSTSTVDIYTFNLAAGDIVADNNVYSLSQGDQLIITTSAAGTNIVMNGNVLRR